MINSDKDDFILDEGGRERVVEEVRHWSGYFIHREQQFGNRRVDGAQLIYPTFLIPRIKNSGDTPPGLSPEERVLRQR